MPNILPCVDKIINNDANSNPPGNFANLLKPTNKDQQIANSVVEPIPIKKLSYINGVSRVMWTEEEVDRMNTI